MNPWMLWPLVALLLAVVVYLFHRESTWVEINHYSVPADGIESSGPVRVVHLTDLHLGPWITVSSLRRAVEAVNALRPDYVLITGDFVTHFREYIPGCGEALAGLKAKSGVIAVLGNHDHWVDGSYIRSSLADAGVTLLANAGHVPGDDSGVVFAGVDDNYTRRHDLALALQGLPEDGFRILLSHSPDIFDEAGESGVDVILCGHTHGGQVRAPFIGALYIPSAFGSRYSGGWYHSGKVSMYVNRGLGEVFPPVRFLCRREIAVFDLKPGAGRPELTKKEFKKM